MLQPNAENYPRIQSVPAENELETDIVGLKHSAQMRPINNGDAPPARSASVDAVWNPRGRTDANPGDLRGGDAAVPTVETKVP